MKEISSYVSIITLCVLSVLFLGATSSYGASRYPPGCNEKRWFLCNSTTTDAIQCPAFDITVSWSDYLSGSRNGRKYKVYPMAGVVFKYSKEAVGYYRGAGFGGPSDQISSKASDIRIGSVQPDKCYTILYKNGQGRPPKGYSSSINVELDSSHPNFSLLHAKDGLAGDPLKSEINIDGVILKFNDAGEVLNFDGVRVGQLQCYKQIDCSAYSIKK